MARSEAEAGVCWVRGRLVRSILVSHWSILVILLSDWSILVIQVTGGGAEAAHCEGGQAEARRDGRDVRETFIRKK